jgi:hypothetical protein
MHTALESINSIQLSRNQITVDRSSVLQIPDYSNQNERH